MKKPETKTDLAIPPISLNRMVKLLEIVQQAQNNLQHELDACAAALGLEGRYTFNIESGVITQETPESEVPEQPDATPSS